MPERTKQFLIFSSRILRASREIPPHAKSQAVGTWRLKSPRRQAIRGFTLIEILLVIGIIAMLVALGAFAATKMMTQGKTQQTLIILQQAANAATEYQAQTTQTVPDGFLYTGHPDWNVAKSYDVPGTTGSATISGAYRSIERFVWAVRRVPEAEKILRTLADHLKDTNSNGFLEVVDSWGTPLKYRTGTTTTSGLPVHKRPFFVSAGPDMQFGSVSSSGVVDAQARDNLYSFELNQSHE